MNQSKDKVLISVVKDDHIKNFLGVPPIDASPKNGMFLPVLAEAPVSLLSEKAVMLWNPD